MTIIYTAHAIAKGGREGHTQTDDGKLSFKLDSPGSGGPGTNPEQLFATGYSACFSGAAAHVAKLQNVNIGDIEVKIDINLNKEESGFNLSGIIDVSLPNVDRETAIKILKDTHAFCPYSRAIRGNVGITLKLDGEEIDA